MPDNIFISFLILNTNDVSLVGNLMNTNDVHLLGNPRGGLMHRPLHIVTNLWEKILYHLPAPFSLKLVELLTSNDDWNSLINQELNLLDSHMLDMQIQVLLVK